jgi:hypothetical protein
MDPRLFVLIDNARRARASHFVMEEAPPMWRVECRPPKRSGSQNDKFHAMCSDIARQCLWGGKRRTKDQWKVLLVSGHAHATKEGAEIVPGLEGEFVNIRESTATMSKARGSSLIEYTLAWGTQQGVIWSDEAVAA